MPELPEVEVITRGLEPLVKGRIVTGVHVPDPSVLNMPEGEFADRVGGQRITGVRRRGKLALVDLETGLLAFHLRMTGSLMVHRPEERGKHVRVFFSLEDGREMSFSDVRRFGSCHYFLPGGLEQWKFYRTLGPEPLDIAPEKFVELFSGRKAGIKGLLLDQKVLAGVGNIYADESLFKAGIDPKARGCDLAPGRLRKLLEALSETLKRAIAENGSSISDYRDSKGDPGSFQNSFNVYGKKGIECPKCGLPLTGCRVAGRGTVYCRKCQQK